MRAGQPSARRSRAATGTLDACELHVERLTTLSAVDAAAWNALAGDSPFLKHEFLRALEESGCVGHGTTWQPCYIVARDEHGLAGALPLFIKYDSHGEFVFDWGWADAYERGGPQLLSEARRRDTFYSRDRSTPVAARGPRRPESRRCCSTQHAARRSRSARRRCTCCFRPSPSGRRSNERGSCAQRLSVPLDERRLRRISTSSLAVSAPTNARKPNASGDAWRKPASCSSTCAATSRPPADWDAIMRVLFANVLAPRPRAVLEPRFFRERWRRRCRATS